MMGKTAKTAPNSQKGSAKVAALFVPASVEAASAPTFCSTAKPSKLKKTAKKTVNFQVFNGIPPGVSVPFISNPKSDGFAANKLQDDPAWKELLHDLDAMSIMQLRNKYVGEANSHGNMLQRVKTHGAFVHPEFRKFKDFLREVGPRPTKGATLDRINNNDPEYAPGKVRWADKTTQNRNKGDSLIFTCPETGRSYNASTLALRQGVSPTAIRKRRKQGWTDAEIINGKRETKASVVPVTKAAGAIQQSAAPLTEAQKSFWLDRDYCDHVRKHDGEEYFPATPAEIEEILADDPLCIDWEDWLQRAEETFLRQLPDWWKRYRPHIRFNALRPHQQAWVLKIDPSAGQGLKSLDAL